MPVVWKCRLKLAEHRHLWNQNIVHIILQVCCRPKEIKTIYFYIRILVECNQIINIHFVQKQGFIALFKSNPQKQENQRNKMVLHTTNSFCQNKYCNVLFLYPRKSIPGEPGKDYPIYSIDILCKINPGQCGGARSGAAAGKPTPAPQVTYFLMTLYFLKYVSLFFENLKTDVCKINYYNEYKTAFYVINDKVLILKIVTL